MFTELNLGSLNTPSFKVSGQVWQSDNTPLSGVIVRAFDKDLRRVELLGETTTDQNGRYEITYTAQQFSHAEKKSADLIVRIFSLEGTLLIASPIIFNSQPVETVDLIVAGQEYKGPSEYERYIEELLPLLGNYRLADLREDDEEKEAEGKFQDITFLSGETNINPKYITFLVLAARLSNTTGLHPEIFYGFFRQNLPTNLPSLLAHSLEDQRRALEAAFSENIIPARLKNELEQLLQRLQALIVQQPTFLFNPKVLFGSLTNLSNLKGEEADFIATKLNQHLRSEILNTVGTVSEAMTRVLQTAVARINYQNFKDSQLSVVITENLLAEARNDKKLAEEAAELANRLAETPSVKISDLLHIDAPVKENPIFGADILRAKTLEYAKLVQLSNEASQKLAAKNLFLDDVDETILTGLVKEGILNDQQKSDLQLTIDLGKLTGDNVTFIANLKVRNQKSVADFISWEKTDWQQLITNEKLPLPPGETAETYAENILLNIERTYPSQFFLNRTLNPSLRTKFNLLDSLDDLLRSNDKLIDGENPAEINWESVNAERREELQKELQEFTGFANTYRHLNIADLVNDKNSDLAQKKSAISARIQPLDTFYKNNPDLDLRVVSFFDSQDGKLNWSNVPAADQPLVKKQLMAYQRSLSLSEDIADSQMLLSKGYDSAVAIASKTEAEFVKTSGLTLGKARMTYAKAQKHSLSVSHYIETIRDAIGGQFKDIAMANLIPTLVNDLREIDGFDDLFGPQDFCDCEECKSILSPAAYFVDLMSFIDQHVSKPVFSTRLIDSLYLRRRRRDLWKLNLTCENTHTLIPYLTIVNEVLEAYLEKVEPGDIFEKFSHQDSDAEKISFALPFNLPLEELRIYLSHFGIALHEISRILKQPDEKIWRARLNLSREEFEVITTADPTGVKFRVGNPASFSNFPVQEFIQFAGISRQQLDELLALNFNPDLQNIKVGKKSVLDELQNFPEILKNLTDSRLDFIHRFIKFWQKTTWSIPELDLVLAALKDASLIASDLNAPAVLYLAQLVDIQEKLKLTVEELCSMAHQLPVSKDFPEPATKQIDRKLFERLFAPRKLFGEDPVTHKIKSSTTFHHYSLNTTNPDDRDIDPNTPMLLGGLGVSETELLLLFDLLKNEMPFDANGNCTLDRQRISLLYRHAKIAKALNLNIEDFIQSLRLNFASASLVVTTLEQIHQLHRFKHWHKNAPFNVSELRFILKGEESNTVKYKNNLETVGAIVQEVQKSQEVDKVKALKAHLSKSFNLTSNQLVDSLQWVNTDTNSAGIQIALNITFTNGVPNSPTDLNDLLALIREMERVLLMFSNLKFKEETITYLTGKLAVMGIANLKTLTLDDLKALTFYKKLITLGKEAERSVQTVLNSYLTASALSSDDVFRLADLWQQDNSLIASLSKSLTLPSVPIQALEYLWECLNLCQTLGINGFSLQNLVDDADFARLSTARDIALGAFSSKYDDEKARQEKLEPYQDKINVKKRVALCDYIIAREEELKFKDLPDLYAFFLLDVEMSGCFRTSRLVCAISSLQLYVHRILTNLEQSASGNLVVLNEVKNLEEFKQEWEWRQNYRVWEANRKVFLYPENYIEPDLRDNKTPIFKELEDELLQEKITEESAEAAYKKYVAQFAELAHLRIAGSYYHEASNTYYFFGRTQQDPPQYYYRKWIDQKIWAPWEKIELAVDSDRISAIIYLGKLYLFWISSQNKELVEISGGNTNSKGFLYEVYLNFSFQNEKGKWISVQKLKYISFPSKSTLFFNQQVFPATHGNNLYAFFYLNTDDFKGLRPYQLDLFQNNIKHGDFVVSGIYGPLYNIIPDELLIPKYLPIIRIYENNGDGKLAFDWLSVSIHESVLNNQLKVLGNPSNPNYSVTDSFKTDSNHSSLSVVGNMPGGFIFNLGNQQYLIHLVQALFSAKKEFYRISTSLPDELGEILFTQGLKAFLSLNTQKRAEHSIGISFTNLVLQPPFDDPNHIDFRGAYGEYYRELFFHIPFLIANHLNANQKFKEAKWWYERIFDPTASEPPDDKKPTDRNWQYIEFRDMTLQKMKEILTDEAAIEQYKEDPFNPHAIARLRLSAYQKAIVMKYIDNLLDWGDYLFAQDTVESINEATMLYVLASDILGKRPAKLGKCETAKDKNLTYEKIGPAIDKGSEFLITLENWSQINAIASKLSRYKIAEALNTELVATNTSSTAVAEEMTIAPATASTVASMSIADFKPKYRVARYTEMLKDKVSYLEGIKKWEVGKSVQINPALFQVKQSMLAFCVPPNYELLKYWDRVEDRLFKIRNCMNLSGARRQLALFQPPIDPMALVRAKAAGLSLEDILSMMNAQLPPYRFSYLIEKAKQFTQTVQAFGSALLIALEKKDLEELTLLRSVHEREILRMTKEIKKQQVREAQYQYQAIVETKTNVQNRIDYHQGLIDGGLTAWEVAQQSSTHTATGLEIAASAQKLLGGILFLLPQLGSPFAMKYGGVELGNSAQAIGLMLSSLASIAHSIATSAALEAVFQRREQEWKQQLLLAQQELKQVEQQQLAADVRQLIAEKDLEVHEKNVEQADELHEFYKNKFTDLGLYNYLSTTLNRLYREAYNVAYDLAKMAELTYQFERDDTTIFIASDNWQFDRAGLLAGERLILQLQRMEKAYLEQHKRDYEVTQSFSLALLDPSALIALKQTGSCEFMIPEIIFDLLYPGQYKRIIKSARVTIPCTTGPYTNISAKLSLKKSEIRKEATTDPGALVEVSNQKLTSIATSNAQNDSGLFELNFRDERYLPFEGAGAISTWGLELPSKLRSFSYDSISDVIIHLSYTAKDDGAFRTTIETNIADALTGFAADNGLYRLLSLKHEFPNALHQLLHSSGTTQATEFELTKQHFPYFLADKELTLSAVKVYLKPKGKNPVATDGLNLKINDSNTSGWSNFGDNLKEGAVTLSGDPIKKWTVNAGTDGLNREEIDDILILLKYTTS